MLETNKWPGDLIKELNKLGISDNYDYYSYAKGYIPFSSMNG
jgi:hypothetical protein